LRRTAGKLHIGMALASRRLASRVSPAGLVSPLRATRDVTQANGRFQPEERHCLAAEVHGIDRRQKNPVRRFFCIIISVPDTFWGAGPRSASPTDPSPSRYPIIDMLPHAWCHRNGTMLIKAAPLQRKPPRGGLRADSTRSSRC
jgi:hypothetical protein